MLMMQTGLLTLLKEFDAICKKHDITYYLEGGSLLGAVRHKGFLPWDDDIDLSITRDNFQKLLSVIDEELPENRELYCYERFPNYLRDTVKYTNLDTTVLFRNHILDGNAAGQHIDLFILDPVPSDAAAKEEYKKYATIYSELLTPIYVLCKDIINYKEEYEQYLKMMEEKGREYVLGMLREKLFTYEDSEACDTYLLRWGNRHMFYPKEWFGKPAELPFEDGCFPAPSQYYRFLRSQFGDSWMIIPDVEHQEEHDTFDNYHVPCKTFIADYSPFIDYEEYRKVNEVRKAHNLNLLIAKEKEQKTAAFALYTFRTAILENMLSELSEEAKTLLEQEKYQELMEYFEPYYNAQLCDLFMKYDVVLSVNPSVLYTCGLSMVMSGNFGKAEKLLRLCKIENESIRELKEMIVDIRSCMLAAEEERYAEAKELAEKWNSRFPLQLNLGAFLISQGIKDEAYLHSLIAKYPNSDELMYLMAVLLEKQGNKKEAMEWYRLCKEISRNGMILMKLPELPLYS